MLAKYFKALKQNERTLVFVAFTAEEVGGFGSQYFSQQFDPNKVTAMFNIEMIGTESKWGKNSAYITGYEKTDMGTILQRTWKEPGLHSIPILTPHKIYFTALIMPRWPGSVYPHTLSPLPKWTSEPNYHKLSDQIETLDMDNMAMIIKSIALSSRTIVSGKDSPARVKVEELR